MAKKGSYRRVRVDRSNQTHPVLLKFTEEEYARLRGLGISANESVRQFVIDGLLAAEKSGMPLHEVGKTIPVGRELS